MECKTEYLSIRNKTFGTTEVYKNTTFLNSAVSCEKDTINKIKKETTAYNQRDSKTKMSREWPNPSESRSYS